MQEKVGSGWYTSLNAGLEVWVGIVCRRKSRYLVHKTDKELRNSREAFEKYVCY